MGKVTGFLVRGGQHKLGKTARAALLASLVLGVTPTLTSAKEIVMVGVFVGPGNKAIEIPFPTKNAEYFGCRNQVVRLMPQMQGLLQENGQYPNYFIKSARCAYLNNGVIEEFR